MGRGGWGMLFKDQERTWKRRPDSDEVKELDGFSLAMKM